MKKRYLISLIVICIILNINVINVSASNKEQLNQTSINLVTGRTRDYTNLKVLNVTGYPKYKSSNKKVAKVNSKGLVKAVGVGKCIITVKVKSKKYKCKVKVTRALSKKELLKKISVKFKMVDGYLFYDVSNKLNKPLKVTFYTSYCNNDGDINDVFFIRTIPAKSTQKWYEQLTPDMAGFKIKKVECEYTNNISKNFGQEFEFGDDVISIPKKKAGIKIENVHLETIYGLFSDSKALYIDGKVYNKTPFDIHTNRYSMGKCFIVFYKNDRIVYIESIERLIGFEDGQNYQFKDYKLNVSNWDYDYDRYEVIYNDGYYYISY